MGKYNSYIIQRFLFLRLDYYILLWSIHRIYYAALKGKNYMTQLLLVPVMIRIRWTIYLEALAVKLINSSLLKQ